MIDQNGWDRLARFAAGECTAEEADAVARWVAEAVERQEALAFIRDVGVAAEVGRPQWDTDASWGRLMVRQEARVRPPLQLTPSLSRRSSTRRRWLIAAAAAIVVAAGTLTSVRQLWHASRSNSPIAVGPLARDMRERVTSRGQRAMFQLPDGTPVILAAASRLRYPVSLGRTGARREVYLEGKALFEVKHDERRPFVVYTAHGATEDLGTRFAVQEYSNDTTVDVVVTEGRVELRKPTLVRDEVGALLRPGQLGRLNRNGDAVVQSGVDLTRYLAWTQGQLVFDDTPLSDALPELSRWYDLNFVLADSALGARRFTAVLSGEAMAETLALLSSTLDINYEWHDRTVTFLPRRHPR